MRSVRYRHEPNTCSCHSRPVRCQCAGSPTGPAPAAASQENDHNDQLRPPSRPDRGSPHPGRRDGRSPARPGRRRFYHLLTARALFGSTHQVVSGDTLWDIAATYAEPGDDVRKAVFHIQQANGLESSVIVPGQELRIPTG